MIPRIKHYLINEKYEDPGIVIEIESLGEYILFDIGNINRLSRHLLRKITKIFVSHNHIDHFIGFDTLLRNKLGKPHTVYIFGIKPLAEKIYHKLQGYIWNLVEFEPQLIFIVKELNGNNWEYYRFDIKKRFQKELVKIEPVNDNVIYEDKFLCVRFAVLDHKIKNMGYSLEYKPRLKLIQDKLKSLNLKGKEIGEFKNFLQDEKNKDKKFKIGENFYSYEYLKDKYSYTIPGYKISYITDVIYSKENKEKIINLVRNSDVLYCEAVFLDRDREQAEKVYHLTTKQTATIANEADVKELVVFHFSRRYGTKTEKLLEEVKKFFPNVK